MPYPPAEEAQHLLEKGFIPVLVGIVAIIILATHSPVISHPAAEIAWELFAVAQQQP